MKVMIWRRQTNESKLVVSSRTFSSDSTVAEVLDAMVRPAVILQSSSDFQLWNTTYNPPVNVTNYMTEFTEHTGPKSLTLHAAGLFPSGSWMVLPKGMTPSEATTADYEDYQYNLAQSQPGSSSGNATVALVDGSGTANARPLPSQVMESVKHRFDEDDDLEAKNHQTKEIILARKVNAAKRLQLEAERSRRLDERIRKLADTSSDKNKNVSKQVRKMLIKSRATGREDLKMQDRIYFECLVLEDGDDSSSSRQDFRYFSPQDTFAKVAASFECSSSSKENNEVLVRLPDNKSSEIATSTTYVYKRFPVVMRVYEAIAQGLLTSDVDTLVIRFYSEEEGPTPSIETRIQEDTSIFVNEMNESSGPKNGSPTAGSLDFQDANTSFSDDRISLAVQLHDEASQKKGKATKKKSAAAEKVRTMQMKAKAKGDAKRIRKMEDRFYLEVLILSKTEDKATSNTLFFHKKDTIDRVLQVLDIAGGDWKVLVPIKSEDEDRASFRIVKETQQTLEEAARANLLSCFGRLVLAQNQLEE